MRIIKEGKESNEIKFVCGNCGCEFTCEEDEYWTDTNTCRTSYPPSYSVYSSCPKCHKVCHTFKRDETGHYTISTNIGNLKMEE